MDINSAVLVTNPATYAPEVKFEGTFDVELYNDFADAKKVDELEELYSAVGKILVAQIVEKLRSPSKNGAHG